VRGGGRGRGDMLVPDRLDDWTYEVVKELAGLGQTETDRHDFKFGLPNADTLTKECCSFANSKGGFVVIGVKQKGIGFIVEGIDPDSEIANKFGQKLRADPTIPFEAPHVLPIPDSHKVLYVFHIPRSPERPHIPSDPDKRIFWKRTNTGCEQMTLEETRAEFMHYEEKREKLKLLFIELVANKEQLAKITGVKPGETTLITLDSSVLERLLVDLYSIIQDDSQLVKILLELREHIRICNARTQILHTQLALSYGPGDKARMAQEHREFMKEEAQYVVPRIERALATLQQRFGLRDPFDTSITPKTETLTLEGGQSPVV